MGHIFQTTSYTPPPVEVPCGSYAQPYTAPALGDSYAAPATVPAVAAGGSYVPPPSSVMQVGGSYVPPPSAVMHVAAAGGVGSYVAPPTMPLTQVALVMS